jgi:mRNA-degrading endonuclease toxin of MazEF toxin-antitoxin module
VLVVSADVRNRTRDHAMVVPIFSQGHLGPTRLIIPAEGAGVRCDSMLFCEELTTLNQSFLPEHRPRGRVAEDLLDQVVLAVRRALGDFSA